MEVTIRWKFFIKKENYLVSFVFEHEGSKFYASNYSDDITGDGHYSLMNMDLYRLSYLAVQRGIKNNNLTNIDDKYFNDLFKKLIDVLSCIHDFEDKIRMIKIVEDDINIKLY